ncbi:O-antigen/teichoic acid export membrane protein [Bacillus sp. AG1163]|uniref:oligosaccharide flippase family protein n=1 Tax=Bacillus sp. AG1163 TaxID=2183999 RepID=UPI001065BC33|nr:oligosaccharide flippase family protein [Bacillus sp. AG1163]TDT79867.1 O-antigen/teichoic acid export membrane protein [Bacillus sp. AG1163]
MNNLMYILREMIHIKVSGNIQKSFVENFSWTLVGNIIYAATQWAIIMVLAKMLGSDAVGIYSLALAVTAPIYMFANLQLRQVQITDINNRFTFGIYFSLRCLSTLLAFGVILIICFFNNYSFEAEIIIILIALAKAIESISDLVFGVFQKNEAMDFVSKSLIMKGIMTLIILCVVLFTTHNFILAILLSFIFTRMFVLLFYDLKNAKKITSIKLKFSKDELITLTLQSLPLGIVMMLISLNENIPRYFLGHYIGVKELGYFSSIAYIPFSGNIVVMALGQAASPRLAKYYAENRIKEFIGMLLKFMVIGVLILFAGLVITILWGENILEILYTKDFAVYNSLLVILMIYFGMSYITSFLGFALTAMRNFKVQPYLIGIVVVTNVLWNLLLVPKYGMLGAAYSMIFTSSIQIIVSIMACYFTVKRKKTSMMEEL